MQIATSDSVYRGGRYQNNVVTIYHVLVITIFDDNAFWLVYLTSHATLEYFYNPSIYYVVINFMYTLFSYCMPYFCKNNTTNNVNTI